MTDGMHKKVDVEELYREGAFCFFACLILKEYFRQSKEIVIISNYFIDWPQIMIDSRSSENINDCFSFSFSFSS